MRVETQNDENRSETVHQNEHEVFAIEESNASGQPRTVMVHAEHAAFASGTVVASFGFEQMANETVPFPSVLRFVHVESLIRGPKKQVVFPG